jgi:hypothetical protein
MRLPVIGLVLDRDPAMDGAGVWRSIGDDIYQAGLRVLMERQGVGRETAQQRLSDAMHLRMVSQ